MHARASASSASIYVASSVYSVLEATLSDLELILQKKLKQVDI